MMQIQETKYSKLLQEQKHNKTQKSAIKKHNIN